MSSNILPSANYPPSLDAEQARQSFKDNTLKKNDGVEARIKAVESPAVAVDKQSLLNDVFSNNTSENIQSEKISQALKNNQPTEKEIDLAIAVVSNFINQPPRNVNFTKDTDSGKTVIKVFELESQELIKQFPSEELISIAQKIKALQQEVGEKAGILFDAKV
jgi:uncharacterized FlaG/YvyC family protein